MRLRKLLLLVAGAGVTLGCLEDFGEYDFVPDAGPIATATAHSTATASDGEDSIATEPGSDDSAATETDGADATAIEPGGASPAGSVGGTSNSEVVPVPAPDVATR